MQTKRFVAIDLFSGAGGISLGFEQAGFNVTGAVEYDPIHAKTYSENFPECNTMCHDIAKVSGSKLLDLFGLEGKQLDVLFGGPPCQGFSFMGKRQKDDPRNFLILEFARLVQETRPLYFVVENVSGLLSSKYDSLVNTFIQKVKKAGYLIVTPINILDASKFGVPQKRKRVFIIGYQKDIPKPRYPLVEENNISPPTIGDAIGDLMYLEGNSDLYSNDTFFGELGQSSTYSLNLRYESLSQGVAINYGTTGLTGCKRSYHAQEIIHRFEGTKPGSIEPISRFFRLDWNGMASTIRAGADRAHGSFTAPRPIHPIYPRCITVREAARIHSFPDWFNFNPTVWHGFRQVGNSVPPLLAKAVASQVKNALKEYYTK